MSYLEPARRPSTSAFGFQFDRCEDGWHWKTYDPQGRIAARGVAPNKAIAAACVIRELARA